MTTVYTVNKKSPTEVHVIKDFVKSEKANYSNDVLFYRQEDAMEFVEFMDDFVSYNIEVDVKTIGFASYGTTVELKMSSISDIIFTDSKASMWTICLTENLCIHRDLFVETKSHAPVNF